MQPYEPLRLLFIEDASEQVELAVRAFSPQSAPDLTRLMLRERPELKNARRLELARVRLRARRGT